MNEVEYVGKQMNELRYEDTKIKIGDYSQESLNTDHEAYKAFILCWGTIPLMNCNPFRNG